MLWAVFPLDLAMPQLSFNTPLGPVTVSEDDDHVVSVDWGWARDNDETPLLREARAQIDAYFDKALFSFDLPLAPPGTAFQQRVWHEIRRVGYGATASYGGIAHALNTGPRAVGGACGRNPIPLIIPCHRVLASHGRIGGYSGLDGIDTKRSLLALEGSRISL